jgi:thioredoxin-related protein
MTPETVLPTPQSLADELSIALKMGQPLVVMVSLERCPFCRVARDSYLTPLRRQEHVPVVQIDMRTAAQVRDFKQMVVTHDDLARAWAIKVAPTVLFFGPGGKEVAERLVGGYIPDFYGAYLDQRMLTARAAVRT